MSEEFEDDHESEDDDEDEEFEREMELGYDNLNMLYRRHTETDTKLRARVINSAIEIDDWIERLIAFHFCPDDAHQILFRSLLFRIGEVTFSRKIKILRELLKQSYPDIYTDYSNIFAKLER